MRLLGYILVALLVEAYDLVGDAGGSSVRLLVLEVEHSASQEAVAIIQGARRRREHGRQRTLTGVDIAEHGYSQVVGRGSDHDGLLAHLALLLGYRVGLLGDLGVLLLFDWLRSVRC